MTLTSVSLIVFAAGMIGCWAFYLIIRDLLSPRDGSVSLKRSLRRVPSVQDEEPATTVSGRLDQEFEFLVVESGIDGSSSAVFLGIVACGLLVGGAVFLSSDNPLLSAMAAAGGLLAPLGLLAIWRSRRMKLIQESMPYVVDLFARAVRAGESVDQAVQLIGTEATGPVAREFNRCARQLELGLSLQSVMKSLTRRLRMTEIRMFASTLMVHRQTGGNLPVALDRMSGVLRDRLTAVRQMRASTGAGRSSTLLMAVVSPIAYVVAFLWYPEHVKILLDDTLGRLLLMIAFSLEVIGLLWVMLLLKRQ